MFALLPSTDFYDPWRGAPMPRFSVPQETDSDASRIIYQLNASDAARRYNNIIAAAEMRRLRSEEAMRRPDVNTTPGFPVDSPTASPWQGRLTSNCIFARADGSTYEAPCDMSVPGDNPLPVATLAPAPLTAAAAAVAAAPQVNWLPIIAIGIGIYLLTKS